MLANKIKNFSEEFTKEKYNFVKMKEKEIQIFDKPLIGYGDVNDSEFLKLKDENIIGSHFNLPTEWLEEGKTVISLFFPFTKEVRNSNKVGNWPSREWLHGRIEGQQFLNIFLENLDKFLLNENGKQIAPSLDKKFYLINHNENGKSFTSNWSERHIGYICGLGTFGLSKGIITEKGMAGRFCSIITSLEIEKTERLYKKYDEYCTYCGRCIKECPVNAITLEKGKEHLPCYLFNQEVKNKEINYYGCGKCQVNVPCENKNPKSKIYK